MASDGGCLAYFATFRPVHGITTETLQRVTTCIRSNCVYWFIVTEKSGHERHAHAVLFPKKAHQRSNLIGLITRQCLYDWTEPEQKNFRRWDRTTKTGAVKTCTHLEVITDYLDGTRLSKSKDPYEIVDQFLPDDLSLLEKYMPDVGTLKRPKNVWCTQLHKQLVDHFDWPNERPMDATVNEAYVLACMKSLENENVREICIDPRIKRNRVVAFTQWWNRNTTGHYGSHRNLPDDVKDGYASAVFKSLKYGQDPRQE